MILEPVRPTQRYIEGRIAFYESGAEFYAEHDQTQLAQWSRMEADKWRAKLGAQGREPGDGE